MGWIWQRQQQQRGAQLHAGGDRPGGAGRPGGEAPKEAVDGREAQKHDEADLDVSGGEPQRDIDYPATNAPERQGDITPSAPEPSVEWDDVVQPERRERDKSAGGGERFDDLPLPEGK